MIDLLELLQNRRSIRSFDKSRNVPRHILEKILDAGRLAPSAINSQPWKFIVVESPGKLERVKKCYNRQWFQDAPQILVVVGNKSEGWVREFDGYQSLQTDLAIAMDHMILMATSLQVGTCWVANFQSEVLRATLGLTEDQEVFCLTPLGYPEPGYETKESQSKRKSLNEVAVFL